MERFAFTTLARFSEGDTKPRFDKMLDIAVFRLVVVVVERSLATACVKEGFGFGCVTCTTEENMGISLV